MQREELNQKISSYINTITGKETMTIDLTTEEDAWLLETAVEEDSNNVLKVFLNPNVTALGIARALRMGEHNLYEHYLNIISFPGTEFGGFSFEQYDHAVKATAYFDSEPDADLDSLQRELEEYVVESDIFPGHFWWEVEINEAC